MVNLDLYLKLCYYMYQNLNMQYKYNIYVTVIARNVESLV